MAEKPFRNLLGLSVLDLWVSNKLERVRASLADSGIPVAMLPLQAASYSTDSSEAGAISIAIPQVVGADPGDRGIGQVLTYTLSVAIRLPKRYSDLPEEIEALETVAGIIAGELVEEYPPLSGVLAPIFLENYDLLQPDGRQWLASINFKFRRSTTAILPGDTELAPEEMVKLVVRLLSHINQSNGRASVVWNSEEEK